MNVAVFVLAWHASLRFSIVPQRGQGTDGMSDFWACWAIVMATRTRRGPQSSRFLLLGSVSPECRRSGRALQGVLGSGLGQEAEVELGEH